MVFNRARLQMAAAMLAWCLMVSAAALPGRDEDWMALIVLRLSRLPAGAADRVHGVGDPDARGEDRVDLTTLRDVATRTGGQCFFTSDEAALTEV